MSKNYGTERIKRKFAFFPTKIYTEDGIYRVFMCYYFIKQRWTKQGSSRIRIRGIFSNVYYDGWETVGAGFDKNVITLRKYRR